MRRSDGAKLVPTGNAELNMRLTQELRDRTKHYAALIVRFYASLPRQQDEVSLIGKELLQSGMRVAGNARAASRARSDAEFCSKLDSLLQEADGSQLWLELLRDECEISGASLERLLGETNEFLAIFTSIVSKVRRSEG